MSSGNGPGRLPSLKSSGASKPGLKFKPKAAVRRSKEEREASAPKLEVDESQRHLNERRRPNTRRTTGQGNQNRRMARYLNNTHVVSTGPLAAGNFIGDKGGPQRSFAKAEGRGASSLVLQGLQNLSGQDDLDDLDDEEEGAGEGDPDKDNGKSAKNRFNMGKEYSIHDLVGDEEEDEADSTEMDEETWRAMKTEELFPVRPVRYRHQDLEVLQNAKQDAYSSAYATREPTPAIPSVKPEPTDSVAGLHEIMTERENQLHKKLDQLTLQQKFQSLDQAESLAEIKSLNEDHERIWKKFNKINNKPNRFVLFQLPSKLPEFEQVETESVSNTEPAADVKEEEDEKKSEKKTEEKSNASESRASEPAPLSGRIGSIRVHKSGRLSAKIGNVVMDISRGTETAFLQDAVTINQDSDAPPFAELLGRVDGRVVITPRF